MKIKKGDKLTVVCSRKGTYDAVATADFDTDSPWYLVAVDQDEPVHGLTNVWYRGAEIPCRKDLAKVKKRKVKK